MRVVVFGASGTIGRVLLPALDREHQVVAVSRRPRAAPSERTHWAVADLVLGEDELAAGLVGE